MKSYKIFTSCSTSACFFHVSSHLRTTWCLVFTFAQQKNCREGRLPLGATLSHKGWGLSLALASSARSRSALSSSCRASLSKSRRHRRNRASLNGSQGLGTAWPGQLLKQRRHPLASTGLAILVYTLESCELYEEHHAAD